MPHLPPIVPSGFFRKSPVVPASRSCTPCSCLSQVPSWGNSLDFVNPPQQGDIMSIEATSSVGTSNDQVLIFAKGAMLCQCATRSSIFWKSPVALAALGTPGT